MKQTIQFFAALLMTLSFFNAQAQSDTGAAYFQGKWNVVVKGTPGGDSKLYMIIEKKDTSYAGTVQDSTGKEIAKIDKLEVNPTKATFYFRAQGYDLDLTMNKIDDDHITGNMLGMFMAEGNRVKEIKQ